MSSAEKLMPPLPSLGEATLEQLKEGLESGQLTSVQLVKAYKRRIDEVNHVFNAVLEINPDAECIAATLDDERREGRARGPLHGIPILLKDSIYTDDRMSASAGSFALLGSRAPREATVARRLREAGALLLGKTNMSEWANYRSSPESSTHGWSARGGQTYGAFWPGTECGESSSGSAVATVLGLAGAAIGTETDGSIVWPAHRCNVVGVKPTTGLVARDGVIPLSSRQDTVGPMTRTVRDAAQILTAIAGKSEYDEATKAIPFETIPDYLHACQATRLEGLRVGVPRDAISTADNIVTKAFDKALCILTSAGATIVDNVQFQGASEWANWSPADRRASVQAEFKHDIETWLEQLTVNPNNLHTLQDIIDFIKSDPRECYPERDNQRLEWAQAGFEYGSPEYTEALQKLLRLAGKQGMTGAMDEHRLDAMVYPTPVDPPTTFAARLRLPAINVPLGFYPAETEPVCNRGDVVDVAPNIPFGITFAGRAFTEETLFRVAHVFEMTSQVRGRVKPCKMPSTELKDVV